jgi:malate dehydrogenase
LRGHTVDIVGGSDYGPTAGSDLVIVTAGVPRQPGQSRADLLSTNSDIVRGVVEEIARRCPDCVLIMVTNPLDEMTTLAWHVSGFPSERVVGMAGALDTSRFRYFVAAELGTTPDRVDALVLGSHGETMVPLPRLARASGRPLTQLLSPDRIDALVERTREAGAEIVSLLPRGSAWLAPSAAIADMAKAMGRGEHRVISACAYLRGEYGLSDVYLGVPVRLGRRGVEEIVELPLTEQELSLLQEAAETVRSRVADLDLPPRDSGEERRGADVTPRPAGPGRERGTPTAREPVLREDVRTLRLQSRVRRAAEQVLWEGGRPSEGDIEALTRAVLERMGSG